MKMKTHKATAKRFRIKKGKKKIKILKRTGGQDHFNSRESGKTKRNKRLDKTMSKTVKKTILRAIPYAKS
jgi:ribosomal protein L35